VNGGFIPDDYPQEYIILLGLSVLGAEEPDRRSIWARGLGLWLLCVWYFRFPRFQKSWVQSKKKIGLRRRGDLLLLGRTMNPSIAHPIGEEPTFQSS